MPASSEGKNPYIQEKINNGTRLAAVTEPPLFTGEILRKESPNDAAMQIPAITIVLVDSFLEKTHNKTIKSAITPTAIQEIIVVISVRSSLAASSGKKFAASTLDVSLNIQKNPPNIRGTPKK